MLTQVVARDGAAGARGTGAIDGGLAGWRMSFGRDGIDQVAIKAAEAGAALEALKAPAQEAADAIQERRSDGRATA